MQHMEKHSFRIREALWPDDKPACLGFIMALQEVEHAFEADRRLDAGVAEEYFAFLIKNAGERHGRVFIAEDQSGAPVGWAAAFEDENEIYVVAEHRNYGYIAELYVVEATRGQGAGRALIAACEDWARGRGRTNIMIGALAGNNRAFGVYRSAGYRPYATMLKKALT